MGDGVINIVGFIAAILSEDNKLYLMEEIENDIHPKALKKLLDLIIKKSANNQFVISTHSNIVIKYLGSTPNAKIHYVDWKPSQDEKIPDTNIPTSTVREVESTPEARMKILQDLGYDFYDFELFSAYLLLEESTAETVIRDFLIPQFVPELVGKIKTISCGGVSEIEPRFIDFQRLFVFIHASSIYKNKAWIIADGDADGKENIERVRKNFKDWPKEHFLNFERDNFEDYYPDLFQNKVKEISSIKDKKERRELKKNLVIEVEHWFRSEPETARRDFEKSAGEVIGILRRIASGLNKR